MRLSAIATFAVATLASNANATFLNKIFGADTGDASAGAFIGCVSAAFDLFGGDHFMTSTHAQCQQTCASRGATYSYYCDTIFKKCICSDSPPKNKKIVLTKGPQKCKLSYYGTHLGTDYQYQRCDKECKVKTSMTKVNSPGECFEQCKNYNYAIVRPIAKFLSKNWGCACGNSPAGGGQALLCGSLSDYVYWQPNAGPVPSGLRKRDAFRAEIAEKRGLCPGGQTACRVASGEGYECVDTSSELESCGGCVHGEWESKNSKASQAYGVDCTSLPAVLPGSVTCNAGRCQVSACEEGFKPVQNGELCNFDLDDHE